MNKRIIGYIVIIVLLALIGLMIVEGEKRGSEVFPYGEYESCDTLQNIPCDYKFTKDSLIVTCLKSGCGIIDYKITKSDVTEGTLVMVGKFNEDGESGNDNIYVVQRNQIWDVYLNGKKEDTIRKKTQKHFVD